jgi:hypothetical protein
MNSYLYPTENRGEDSKYKKTKEAMNVALDNLMRSAMGEYLGKPMTSLGK